MVVQKYGLSNWNEETGTAGNSTTQKRDEFMRLQDGTNVVRIVTEPHQYYAHKFKENKDDPGFGDKIMCSKPAHNTCPICDQKDRPKRRWLVGVIDRKTGTTKILDISYTVYQAIQNYHNEEDFGNPANYDIDIKVNRQGGATGYYGVVPKLPKPLTENDLKLVEGLNKESLVRLCTPPTPAKVMERWNSIREKKGMAPISMPEASSLKETPVSGTDVDMSDAENFDFPSVNA